MAAQEWDWFQREELIGQISDIRVQNLQVERENVQKRTFTRWINLHLEKCDPPLEVKDLFVDIQDGKVLMALLEVLSGRNLLHEYKFSSHRIFRLNNIAKALKFLEDSNVKLVSIDAAEIADGNPSLVLGLIWNIILFFQIKELTGNLSRNSPSSCLSPSSGGTDSDSSFPPTPTAERSAAISVKDQRKAIRTLLAWVQRKTRKYGVAVQDFAGSWRSGLAFLAVIKAIDPSLVDMKQALEDSMRENLEKAFSVAHDALHIPRLLEPEDIMVDAPDEQSIVTYVAQFLEHFPELEAEDFVDSDREAPIESTFVRIKETPSEQESTVFFLAENGEHAYTVNHETSHPPPSKVFVCDKPKSVKESSAGDVVSHALSDTSDGAVHQPVDQGLQGVPGRTSSISEPSSESPVLPRKDNRGSLSLPIKKTVHFEADTYKDASCSKDAFHSPDFGFEGSPGGTKELLEQDGYLSEVAEAKPEQDVPRASAAPSDETPGDVPLGDSVSGRCQSSPSWNGAWEPAASQGEEGHPQSPFGEDTVMAESLEIKVQLQTVEAMDEEGFFEGIPLKASKFNSNLFSFASTSQAFGEEPGPPENKPAEEEGLEEYQEELGGRRSQAACGQEGSDEPPGPPGRHGPHVDPGQEEPGRHDPRVDPGQEEPGRHGPRADPGQEEPGRHDPRVDPGQEEPGQYGPRADPGQEEPGRHGPRVDPGQEEPGRHDPRVDPGQEEQDRVSAPEEALVDKKPEVYEKAKRKSPRRQDGEEEGDDGPRELGRELPSDPPSSRASLETLGSRSEDRLDFRPSPPLSKVSVIPHDLFYYPHYEVPLAAVLEAFAEGLEDFKSEEMDFEDPEDYLYGMGPREEAEEDKPEEPGASKSSYSFSVPGEDLPQCTIQEADPGEDLPQSTTQEAEPDRGAEGARPATPPPTQGDQQQREAEDSAPVESHQSQDTPVSENSAHPLEEKVTEESVSSKKKEKKKHVEHKESSIFIAPATVRSSDDLEEDIGDHRVPSRTSHSDSSIYIRRHANRSLEADHFSYVQLRNAADLDDRRNRMLTRKANHCGEATLQDGPGLQSDSLTQLVQQPDMMYFILFLWLLVYCLLLFPQLDVSRL
ncbi:calmin isoform X2 [Saccopteryx bilineata]|uniref:calmin isoform X2 n=1 Tax=Saccopteryx bilineata TaxID=59482 RepID=UPI00338FF37C